MKKYFQYIVALALASQVFSCEVPKCCDHPMSFIFTITNSEGTSYFLQKPDMKIYTLKEGQKSYISYFQINEFPDTTDAYKYKYFWRIDYMNSDSFKRNYFLELPGGDIDTLYLDVRKGINLPDNVFESKFNSKPIEIDDQSIKYWQIHLFKK